MIGRFCFLKEKADRQFIDSDCLFPCCSAVIWLMTFVLEFYQHLSIPLVTLFWIKNRARLKNVDYRKSNMVYSLGHAFTKTGNIRRKFPGNKSGMVTDCDGNWI